jgi:hypothetical protein
LLAGLITACARDKGMDTYRAASEKKIKKRALAIAEKYAMSQVPAAKKTFRNNMTLIGDPQKSFVIDTARVYTGLVDEDSTPDAIVSLATYTNQYPDYTRHLIITGKGRKLKLASVVESDLNILRLQDRIITAEVPTRPRSSPLYNCHSCQKLVDFQFRAGVLDTVKRRN